MWCDRYYPELTVKNSFLPYTYMHCVLSRDGGGFLFSCIWIELALTIKRDISDTLLPYAYHVKSGNF